MPVKDQKEYDRVRNQNPKRQAETRLRTWRLRQDNLIVSRAREVERKRESMYNVTPEDFQEMLREQDCRCAICKESFIAPPCVDHDHSCCSGKTSCGKCVRGLLCANCNSGIGFLRDSVLLLESALTYLRR